MKEQSQLKSEQNREKKKAEFSNPIQKRNRWRLIAPLVVVIGVGAYVAIRSSSDKPVSNTVTSTSQTSGAQGAGDIRIPVSDIESGKAKFFDYTTSDRKPVRFFAVKSSDGVYRAALDACDVCYHAKKGYKQDGDNMICQKCGLPFQTSRIGEVAGGCNPVGIPRSVEGDSLVIKTSELEKLKSYF